MGLLNGNLGYCLTGWAIRPAFRYRQTPTLRSGNPWACVTPVAIGVMLLEAVVSQLVIGVMLPAIVVMRVAVFVTQLSIGVSQIPIGVMAIGTGVTRCTTVVMQERPFVL